MNQDPRGLVSDSNLRVRASESPVVRFHLSSELDQQRSAAAIEGLAGWNLHPALADAILLHVLALLVVSANADIVLKHCRHMVGLRGLTERRSGRGGRSEISDMTCLDIPGALRGTNMRLFLLHREKILAAISSMSR